MQLNACTLPGIACLPYRRCSDASRNRVLPAAVMWLSCTFRKAPESLYNAVRMPGASAAAGWMVCIISFTCRSNTYSVTTALISVQRLRGQFCDATAGRSSAHRARQSDQSKSWALHHTVLWHCGSSGPARETGCPRRC